MSNILYILFCCILSAQAYGPIALKQLKFELNQDIPAKIRSNAETVIENHLTRYPATLSTIKLQQLEKIIPNILEKSMEPFGYFHSQCSASYQDQPSHSFKVNCKLGPATTLTSIQIQIQGHGKEAIEQTLKNKPITLQQGDQFTTEKYESTKQHLLNIAYQHGFMQASTKGSLVNIYKDHNHASITLILESKQGFTFGPIIIHQDIYAKKFLQNLAPFQSHDQYQADKVYSYQNILRSTQLFSEVSVQPKFNHHDNLDLVPIELHYKPIHKMQKRFAVGYNLDTQCNLMLGITRNRIGKKGEHLQHEFNIQNLFQHGPRKKWSLTNSIVIPRTNPSKDYYSLNLDYNVQNIVYDYPNINSHEQALNWTTAYNYIKNIGKFHEIQTHIGLNLLLNWDTPFQNNRPTSSKRSQWLFPSLKNSYTFNLKQQQIISKTSTYLALNHLFLKTQLENNLLFTLNSRLRLLLRNKFGFIISKNPSKLPKSWNYLTGGNTSVRGYDFQSIGTQNINPDNQAIFNTMLVENSIELQHQLTQQFYLIAYHDIGQASNNIFNQPLAQSIGSGIIFESPFGTVEMSIAIPVKMSASTRLQQHMPRKKYRFILAFKNKFY